MNLKFKYTSAISEIFKRMNTEWMIVRAQFESYVQNATYRQLYLIYI